MLIFWIVINLIHNYRRPFFFYISSIFLSVLLDIGLSITLMVLFSKDPGENGQIPLICISFLFFFNNFFTRSFFITVFFKVKDVYGNSFGRFSYLALLIVFFIVDLPALYLIGELFFLHIYLSLISFLSFFISFAGGIRGITTYDHILEKRLIKQKMDQATLTVPFQKFTQIITILFWRDYLLKFQSYQRSSISEGSAAGPTEVSVNIGVV